MASSSTSSSTEEEEPLAKLNARPNGIQWIETIELGYASDDAAAAPGTITAPAVSSSGADSVSNTAASEDNNNKDDCDDSDTICFYCQSAHAKLFRCAKCHVAAYCQKECQVNDWKTPGGHKHACDSYKRLGRHETFANEHDMATARQDVFARLRLYACAYAVFKTRNLGRGFLLLQSPFSLAQMSLGIPKDCRGRLLAATGPTGQQPRAMLLHYLTLGEFDAELCRDDFEMALLRTSLRKAVLHDYNDQTHVVVLFRFRCGHAALGLAPLAPDYHIALKLGLDYFAETDPPSLQLNMDDA